MKDLKWQYTKPVKRPTRQFYVKQMVSFEPRERPHNYFEYTDSEIHDMEPTEYLISYSNELTAIGFAKDLDKLGNRPLTMRFGTIDEHVDRKIYIGCVIVVKSYVRMVIEKDQRLLKYPNLNSDYRDIFYNDRPHASTLATKWAIVHKPKIERSPGYVIEFEKTSHKNQISFNGLVFDEKYRLKIEVHNDLWPMYIKKEVPVETPVMISWVMVDEPHSMYSTHHLGRILLPSGASILDLKDVKEVPGKDYWVMCVDTEFDLDSTVDDGLQWLQTRPVKPLSPQDYLKCMLSIEPRGKPYNYFEGTDEQIHEMDPLEYLICHSNEFSAIGFARQLDNLKDQPLTMRFGTVDEHVGREIYIGCVVVVKSYVQILNGKGQKLKRIIDRHSRQNDIFVNGRPKSNTVATEWAVVHKPTVERSLGYVVDFQTYKNNHNHIYFTGGVFDQENKFRVDVFNDNWPLYIKKELPIESAVILSWVKLEGAHAICPQKTTGNILLPSGASNLDLKGVKEIKTGDYWLLWADTNCKASRF